MFSRFCLGYDVRQHALIAGSSYSCTLEIQSLQASLRSFTMEPRSTPERVGVAESDHEPCDLLTDDEVIVAVGGCRRSIDCHQICRMQRSIFWGDKMKVAPTVELSDGHLDVTIGRASA